MGEWDGNNASEMKYMIVQGAYMVGSTVLLIFMDEINIQGLNEYRWRSLNGHSVRAPKRRQVG